MSRHGVHYGGVVAAPVFKEIAEATLRYLGVPPSTSVVASTARPAKKGDAKIATARLGEADSNAVEGLGSKNPWRLWARHKKRMSPRSHQARTRPALRWTGSPHPSASSTPPFRILSA